MKKYFLYSALSLFSASVFASDQFPDAFCHSDTMHPNYRVPYQILFKIGALNGWFNTSTATVMKNHEILKNLECEWERSWPNAWHAKCYEPKKKDLDEGFKVSLLTTSGYTNGKVYVAFLREGNSKPDGSNELAQLDCYSLQ